MSSVTISNFFNKGVFFIPAYQRDYAWIDENINELFDDIKEALLVESSHYIGTLILSRTSVVDNFDVVDGQQRLTTLTILLDALIKSIEDQNLRTYYTHIFINNPVHGRKLNLLGGNRMLFDNLLNGITVTPVSDGQERLINAYRWINKRISDLSASGGQVLIRKWLDCIANLEVLEFTTPNQGKAIRMFQSVNDRGVPLSKMDIVKSLLIYYSNFHLDGKLDAHVANQFGEIFSIFSTIKRMSKEDGFRIDNINRKDFTEDSMLRHHYLSFKCDGYGLSVSNDNYWVNAQSILDTFLKPNLRHLSSDRAALEIFIKDYVDDLLDFFKGLKYFIDSTRSDPAAYLLWCVQGLSAALYSLVIRMQLLGYTHKIGTSDSRNLLELVELIDIRVFKIGGFNREAWIYDITKNLASGASVANISNDLVNYCNCNMSDALMKLTLTDRDFYNNSAQSRILLYIEQCANLGMSNSITHLQNVISSTSIEHILPQDTGNSFSPKANGFVDDVDYEMHKHRLGNLVLLENKINSTCQNKTVHAKFIDTDCYPKSNLQAVKDISSASLTRGSPWFDKSDLNSRSDKMAQIIMKHWHL